MPRRRPFAELVALAFVALVSVSAERGARATPTAAEITQARERFATARKLEDAGRWAEALSLLQRVAEVKMTPQVRFHVALCLENVGLWTQALDGYAQAAGEAGGATDVLKEANEHLHKLEQAIPTVSLSADGTAPGDELLLDRRRLPLDDRPLPIRADPGPHTAEVRRGGAVLAREYFALEPRSTRRIELHLGAVAPEPGQPALEPAVNPVTMGAERSPPNVAGPSSAPKPPGGSPAPPVTPGGAVTPPPLPPAATGDASSTLPAPPAPRPTETSDPTRQPDVVGAAPAPGGAQRALGWTSLGVGGASAVLTGVFIGLRAGAMTRLEQVCPALVQCPNSLAPTVGDGKTDAALVNVFGVIGGVAAAAGVVLLITAPVSTAPRPAAIAWLELRADGRLGLRGTF